MGAVKTNDPRIKRGHPSLSNLTHPPPSPFPLPHVTHSERPGAAVSQHLTAPPAQTHGPHVNLFPVSGEALSVKTVGPEPYPAAATAG